jgi:hypothetical protein
MPPRKKVLPTHLTLEEIQKLLVIKRKMNPLEKKKTELEKELARIEAALKKLMAGTVPKKAKRKKKARKKKATRKKVTRKKVARKATKKKARKKVARKKVARKKTTRKKAVKKVARKKTTRKKAVKKVAKKKARKKVKKAGKAAPAKGKATLEDVIGALIKQNGKPLPFQTILKTIMRKKLVKTKSKNFANVLRRTLSTSKKIKRVGRGMYDTK